MIEVKIMRQGSGLADLAAGLKSRASLAIGMMAMEAASIARQLCPVRTGFLRDSIFAESKGELQWAIGASARYAGYVEFGTPFTPAQPFITPAVDAVRGRFAEIFRSIK